MPNNDTDTDEGGWFCDRCSTYFNENLDACPDCGAKVDLAVGVALTPRKIIRFYEGGGNEVIERGVTLAEAREHCNDPSSKGEGWFDGYDVDEG